jgi:dipeptidyl-peptidase-4
MADQLTFPRQYARTQRFTLGAPRGFVIAPDGGSIAFLRTKTGTDRATCLWTADPGTGAERLIADPVHLLAGGAGEELTAQERARRERSRQGAAGIVDFATDSAVTIAAFMLSGRLFVADLRSGEVRELPVVEPVIDPRPNPSGTHVAYVSGGALRVVGVDGLHDRALATPENDHVSYGTADFVAAEELDRFRGYWWSPDGSELLVARVDEEPVGTWYIADPANPGQEPNVVRYPAAGTANARVELFRLGLDGSRSTVGWDAGTFEYLVSVHWSADGPALLAVLTRDQRHGRILVVAPDGTVSTLHEERDAAWVEFFPGAPVWAPTTDGATPLLARIAPDHKADTYRLYVGDRAITPAGLQVRSLVSVTSDHAYLVVSGADPTRTQIVRAGLLDGEIEQVSAAGGINAGVVGGDLAVVVSTTVDQPTRRVSVVGLAGSPKELSMLNSVSEVPALAARPVELVLGERGLRAALLLPTGHVPGAKLPVLMDPYGGPHAQMVLSAHNMYLNAQWLADQGFAVLVVDGRGAPGRGPAWDRAVRADFAGVTLEDQVDALAAAAAQFAASGLVEFDLTRVGIRGWSFGGYLAALAVLKRPDVFQAAVVGAPVTDWRLYDTAYTERYLGHPDHSPEVYAANSLVPGSAGDSAGDGSGDGSWAWAQPARPMMIIHGLADDNVVAAHTLRLSSALLAQGRPHEVLPLSGVTHMTPQEVVAENLLLLQVDFLKRALSIDASSGGSATADGHS